MEPVISKEMRVFILKILMDVSLGEGDQEKLNLQFRNSYFRANTQKKKLQNNIFLNNKVYESISIECELVVNDETFNDMRIDLPISYERIAFPRSRTKIYFILLFMRNI